MATCVPELAETLPDGQIRWRCPRCGRGGVTPQTLDRVRPGECRARIELGPARRSPCGGCARRRQWLNRLWPGAGDLVTRWVRWFEPAADRRRPPRLLLRFGHGFGDAVQLTVVLQHLRQLRPDWEIDLLVKPGWGSLYRGLARRVVETELPRAELASHAELAAGTIAPGYDLDCWLDFPEPETCYADSPSTKAERCLRETFELAPIEALCDYATPFGADELAAVERYLATLPRGAGVVLIHYQGRTVQQAKNLDERIVADVCRRAREAGCIPVVLDFERPVRSRLVDQQTVFCPTIDNPLWGGRGVGDAATIAALAHRARLCVGIDSGPGHVMAGAQAGTPTLIVWRGGPLHPVHYFPPAGHVTHVVPREHLRALRGDAANGRRYFRERYRAIVCEAHLRRTLPLVVEDFLASGTLEPWLAPRELEFASGHWLRPATRDDDLAIVNEVWRDDVYGIGRMTGPIERVLDVGAHLGSFATRVHQRFPRAAIACVEPHADAHEALARNVRLFAQIVPGAVHYGPGRWQLVEPHGLEAPSNARLVEQPLREGATVTAWTIEGLLAELGWPSVDLLKLDCEGSEWSILENLACQERLRWIVGEYHGGRARLVEIAARRFAGWHLTWLVDKRPACDDGTFWLARGE